MVAMSFCPSCLFHFSYVSHKCPWDLVRHRSLRFNLRRTVFHPILFNHRVVHRVVVDIPPPFRQLTGLRDSRSWRDHSGNAPRNALLRFSTNRFTRPLPPPLVRGWPPVLSTRRSSSSTPSYTLPLLHHQVAIPRWVCVLFGSPCPNSQPPPPSSSSLRHPDSRAQRSPPERTDARTIEGPTGEFGHGVRKCLRHVESLDLLPSRPSLFVESVEGWLLSYEPLKRRESVDFYYVFGNI